MNIKELSKLINSKYVHQIRSGDKHGFIDITIIETEGRFFIRQYKFGTKSWREAFLKEPKGEMKIGDKVFKIDGVVPKDLDEINPKINWAYHKKFFYVFYFLMRLTYSRKKHEESTIELIPQDIK